MKKRALLITTLIVIAAFVLVICVEYFAGEQSSDYDGTLVREGLSGVYAIMI